MGNLNVKNNGFVHEQYICFLFSVTQMQLHVIPSHFASVVTESGVAEEVKMVKDPMVQKGDKEC